MRGSFFKNAFDQGTRGHIQLNIFILTCFNVEVYEMSYGELFRIAEAMKQITGEQSTVTGKKLCTK